MAAAATADAALAPYRVLDLTEGGFNWCGRVLADLGADVVKVEPPGGDSARQNGPFPGNVKDPDWSGLYLYLNANKRGITLDVPSGNIDVAPTILNLLGLPVGDAMDGRVLAEALAGGPDPETVDWSNELYNTERRLKEKVYRQQIKLSVVGGTTYVDQGNSTLGWR